LQADAATSAGEWIESPLLGYGSKGERVSIDEFVPFRCTPTRFGGHRQWFMCRRCGRRCRRLFGGRYFWCWEEGL